MVRTRINVQGVSTDRMDLNEIWVGGYMSPMTSAFTPDLDLGEENIAVFGYQGMIDTRIVNRGTLSATLHDHVKSRDTIAVLKNIDPTRTGLMGYRPDGSFTVDVVRLKKHHRKARYIRAELYPAWNCVLRPAQGGPRDNGSRVLDGSTDIYFEFEVRDQENESIAIAFDVCAMTVASPATETAGVLGITTLTAIPDDIPDWGGKFALIVEAQQRDAMTGVIKKSQRLTVTDDMVDATGAVTVTTADLGGSIFNTLAEVTHCWVVFLVYHATTTDPQMLGDGLAVRGRFDTTT
jgi:hypothetical protein